MRQNTEGRLLTGLVLAVALSLAAAATLPAPTGLQSVVLWAPGKAVVRLSWKPGKEVLGYTVDRRAVGGRVQRLTATPVREPRYDDQAVVLGTTYTYTVTAIGLNGVLSRPSAPLTVTVPAGGPPSPTPGPRPDVGTPRY